MNTTAVLLVVLSAAIHASRDFLTKKAGDKQVFMWWYQLWGVVFFLPLFLYFFFSQGVALPIAIYLGLFSGVVYFIYWFFLAKTYEEGDLSRVYPITRSSPALVLVFSILVLDEHISLLGGLGIGLTVIGVYTINMKRFSAAELVAPIRSIRHDRPTQFAFLTLLSVTAYSIIDRLAIDYLHPVIYLFLLSLCGTVFFTPYILKTKDKATIRAEWQNNKKAILLNGIFVLYGYILILIAFTLERLSYVVSLRQLSIVFAVLMGSHLLQEPHKLIRFLAAAVIVAGAILISIST
jgi:drug/metabolite transporter (DMT)-like permease